VSTRTYTREEWLVGAVERGDVYYRDEEHDARIIVEGDDPYTVYGIQRGQLIVEGDGTAIVYGDGTAIVYGDGTAIVYGYGTAVVHGYGTAVVYGYGTAVVYGLDDVPEPSEAFTRAAMTAARRWAKEYRDA